MFQFPPCPPSGLCVQPAVPGYCPGGFPHSGIPGSKLDDSSPRLFAAIHALLRLLTPRHPPYALSSLIHARRQFLIRLVLFRSVVKVPTRLTSNVRPSQTTTDQRYHLLDVSLSGTPELSSEPPDSYPSRSCQTQNSPAYHRAMLPQDSPHSHLFVLRSKQRSQICPHTTHRCISGGPEWIRTTDPCVISTVL